MGVCCELADAHQNLFGNLVVDMVDLVLAVTCRSSAAYPKSPDCSSHLVSLTLTPCHSISLTDTILPQALEKDLEDVKAQLMTADGLQQQLDAVTAQLTAARSQQQQLQEELVQARSRSSQLEYDLHGTCVCVCVWQGDVCLCYGQ